MSRNFSRVSIRRLSRQTLSKKFLSNTDTTDWTSPSKRRDASIHRSHMIDHSLSSASYGHNDISSGVTTVSTPSAAINLHKSPQIRVKHGATVRSTKAIRKATGLSNDSIVHSQTSLWTLMRDQRIYPSNSTRTIHSADLTTDHHKK